MDLLGTGKRRIKGEQKENKRRRWGEKLTGDVGDER
jgi:hypothetical protein